MLIWFFKSPIYRYGYSFIISFLAILFAIFFVKIGITKNVMKKITGFILILTITVFLVRTFIEYILIQLFIITIHGQSFIPWIIKI